MIESPMMINLFPNSGDAIGPGNSFGSTTVPPACGSCGPNSPGSNPTPPTVCGDDASSCDSDVVLQPAALAAPDNRAPPMHSNTLSRRAVIALLEPTTPTQASHPMMWRDRRSNSAGLPFGLEGLQDVFEQVVVTRPGFGLRCWFHQLAIHLDDREYHNCREDE